MHSLEQIRNRLLEHFPHHSYVYFGVSGTTLLFEALRSEPRRTAVFPAFICPSIPAMALAAGKSVLHVDVDPSTMHPDPNSLETCLSRGPVSNCALLINHSFGYPFPGLGRLRSAFPELLIIEDCARALGVSIGNRNPGEHSDWILLSMYKTIDGSRNGAVLLSRTPLDLKEHPAAAVTFRERAATVGPLRFVHDLAHRRRARFAPPSGGFSAPNWIPQYGSPNRLCLDRFVEELDRLEHRAARRRQIAIDLREALSPIDGIECIRWSHQCKPAAHFVSFRMRHRQDRDHTLVRLQKQGLFLSRTWNLVPANYECFTKTFWNGHHGSTDLWNRIAHIPVRLFLDEDRRRRLLEALRER